MSTIATVTLEGLPATVARLQELPKRIAKRCMLKSIRAGGAPLIKAAKRAAPRATGLFARSLDQRTVSYQDGQAVVSIVGQKSSVKNRKKLRKGRGGISGRGDLVPIHLVENPTRPHRIPREYRKVRVKTSKEYRDAQRALGLWRGAVFRTESRKPMLIRLPSGQRVFVEKIEHPGTKGQHPIRTAAETAAADAGNRFADKLEVEVNREASALGSNS